MGSSQRVAAPRAIWLPPPPAPSLAPHLPSKMDYPRSSVGRLGERAANWCAVMVMLVVVLVVVVVVVGG